MADTMSTPFDADNQHARPFNWYFFLTCGLAVIAGSLVVHQILLSDDVYGQLLLEQDNHRKTMLRYVTYRDLSCDANQFSDDLLLKKIANDAEPLDQSYVPDTLVSIPRQYVHPWVGDQKVRSDIIAPLSEMVAAAQDQNIDLRVNSAYRSFERQREVYDLNTDDVFITKPERAARPGYSEHQLGAAVDISQYPNNGQQGYQWLRNNAYKYGFVLSYPDGAEDVTEFMFEPWHWRYVGIPIAQYVHGNNMLFNHERGLLLPSPLELGTELSYEYNGRDIWVWKYIDGQQDMGILVQGNTELAFTDDVSQLMKRFTEGTLEAILGQVNLANRDWLLSSQTSTYVDGNGQSWLRTGFASPDEWEQIERIEVLYRDDVGYIVISYQTQEAGERLVREFTATCTTG